MSTRKELARLAAAAESIAAAPSARNTAHVNARARDKMPLTARFVLWWGAGPSRERLAVQCLSSFEISAFVGPNGGGKTLALMVFTARTRKGVKWRCRNPDHAHTARGEFEGYRKMLSTVPILRGDGSGELHPLYVKFDDFQQLLDIEHADIYMDEIVTVASSRQSLGMDPRVLAKLLQLRKFDLFLFWTAPNWARADKAMREVTKAVVECRGYYSDRSQPEDGAMLWRPKRVFNFRIYDAVEFEDWTAGKREKTRSLFSLWFKGPGSDAFKAYDTLGAVSMVASITPENTCTVCDGQVVRHRCACKKPRPQLTPPLPESVALMPSPHFEPTLTPPGAPLVDGVELATV